MATKHLIVISFDAMSSSDYEHLSNLPNFNFIKENGAYAKKVYSVYPSLTYPAHTTIVTGKYPDKHGIINNTLLQPGSSSPDWYWHRKHIKCDTIFDKAIAANMSTAALLWPVTANSKIKYNMPEIFPNRFWDNQIFLSLRSGSPLYLIDINNKFGKLRNGLKQPELDDFVLAASTYTIKKYKPNLMMIHFTDLDTQRHDYGYSSKEALNALNRHDRRLGAILEALKDEGILEASTIIALGDHSALDVNKVIDINVLFIKHNLITLNKKGKIKEWKAYLKSCDGSAYVYLKDKQDKTTERLVYQILKSVKAIEKIYNSEDAKKIGADSGCTFMLEASLGYYFDEAFTEPLIKDINLMSASSKDSFYKATHGYSPYKPDYTTMFMAYGNGIRPTSVIESMSLVDEAPTFAKLLNLDFEASDGKILTEILL
jgi:predicted AlkP superfamily pyrophosphatase or phosphodiesterase